jgi:hypothetical protein
LPWLLATILLAGGWASAAETIDYTRQIKPILKQRCYACHGAMKRQAGLRLDTGGSIRRGGDTGPAVEPGHAGESLLIDRVTETDPAERMPPEGAPLAAAQIALLRAWIDQGAGSPADEQPETDPRRHWAFRKPVRPAVPEVKRAARVHNPIDAFLAREHEKRGLTPVVPAAPNLLLRRLYLDLVGLPPTRAELHEFLADPSEPAYRRVVDRLLSSPQYGERWARHWMDVWRYSDWYGRRAVPDVLNSYARIWRWRDWIVRSLNQDKGYDRMVQEMLAADELAPTDAADLVATGFLVRNWFRWNYNSWMKDNVEHTAKAFLGLTLNCAHCHDHKYDPIKQEEYFAFRAFFEPLELRHDRVPGEPDPGPYPPYDYGKAYGPIQSGLVRVFDAKLDAQTFLYTRGESRNVVPGQPPIPPGVPAFLAGGGLRIEPLDLPAEAAHPGLKAFVQREEIAQRESAVAEAEQALAGARDRAAAGERALAKLEARRAESLGPRAFAGPEADIAAFDEADPPPAPELLKARADAAPARAALRIAERQRAYARADLAAVHARIAADRVRFGGVSGDIDALRRAAARAERQAAAARAAVELARVECSAKSDVPKAEARKALETARAALGRDSTEYTPLSPTYPTRSTGRRTALARWITGRDNPLTARVAVNHIWRWHFGTPLVASTSDFGRNGKPPTHPELLDWLAVELMEPSAAGARPWSMKAIHRLIVTSASYRMSAQASNPADPNRAVDPENRWSWRAQPARMEAEEVRDSLLHVAGALDPAMGGADIDFAQGLTSRRRSLYFTHHGEARMPFLELFDAPDACDCYRRTTSVVPQQALALVNNELLLDLSRRLAESLWSGLEAASSSRDRDQAFVTAAFEQVLSRPPSPPERALTVAFLARQARLVEGSGDEPGARARRDLVHALFSHNDFITIH